MQVPGAAALSGATGGSSVSSVSCASAGNCTAGGTYSTTGYGQVFVVSEKNGTWGSAALVTGTTDSARNAAGSVSCASAGNCAAGGEYLDSSSDQQAFVVSENNGTWSKAIEAPGSAALNTGGSAQITSVSCTSARYCVAAGNYTELSGIGEAFLVSRT